MVFPKMEYLYDARRTAKGQTLRRRMPQNQDAYISINNLLNSRRKEVEPSPKKFTRIQKPAPSTVEGSEFKKYSKFLILHSVFCLLLWCVAKARRKLVKWLNNSPITSYQLQIFEKGGLSCVED